MIQIKYFTFNPFMENTFILFDEGGPAIIIDPGCSSREEEKVLADFIRSHKLNVEKIVNTHCHIDHVLGNFYCKQEFGAPLIIHKTELPMLRAVSTYASNYGFNQYHHVEPDAFIKEGEDLTFGEHRLKTLFVPGHSPGHVAFYSPEQKFCIGGDVLFQGSIGRTDLPGGDYDTLIRSIKTKLLPLEDEYVVHSGHGPITNIVFERKNNPVLQ